MLRDLIRYVVWRVADEGGTLGVTRLVKLLYLMDAEYYRRHRKILTGLNWLFYRYGPYAFEIPEILRSLDVDIPQDEVPIGNGRTVHRFKPTSEIDIEAILSTSDAALVERVIARWGLEDLNSLLSHVYFDTEPMQGAKLREPLDFTRIPKPAVRKQLDEDKLRLTREETARFKLMLEEHKVRRSREMKLAEKQYSEAHRLTDPIYEKAMKESQDRERSYMPVGMQVTASFVGDEAGLFDTDDDG